VVVEVRVMRGLIALGVFALGSVSVAADTPAELITKLGFFTTSPPHRLTTCFRLRFEASEIP
jgi:hypothetical protein